MKCVSRFHMTAIGYVTVVHQVVIKMYLKVYEENEMGENHKRLKRNVLPFKARQNQEGIRETRVACLNPVAQ